MTKNWWKHGRYAMSVCYTTDGEPYFVLQKSYINKRIIRK